MLQTIPTDFNATLNTLAEQIVNQMRASGQKGFQPTGPNMPVNPAAMMDTLAEQIVNQMRASGQKGFQPFGNGHQYQNDAIKFASLLAPGLAQAIASKKGTKAFSTETFSLTDPRELQDKSWWNDVVATVEQFTPYVATALSGGKAFEAQNGLANVQPEHLQDKAWWNDVLNIVSQAVPYISNALSGNKDYKVGSSAQDAPVITISNEHINDKAWWNDALRVAGTIIPPIIAAL